MTKILSPIARVWLHIDPKVRAPFIAALLATVGQVVARGKFDAGPIATTSTAVLMAVVGYFTPNLQSALKRQGISLPRDVLAFAKELLGKLVPGPSPTPAPPPVPPVPTGKRVLTAHTHPRLRTGKLPATKDHRDLKFSAYRRATLPRPPRRGYGHASLVPVGAWGMLGNDEWGDCAIAGPGHETMIFTAEGSGQPVAFTTAGVLSDYSAITGFNPQAGPPGRNPTDQGSNVRDVLKYRQATGMVDAAGFRHRIGAYVALTPGNITELYEALYLFGAVGCGFAFPESAMRQFEAGQAWAPVKGEPDPTEGHYVPIVQRRGEKTPVCVTWGRIQLMTEPFYKEYNDEAWCFISEERLRSGKTLDGFDLDALTVDLRAIQNA